MFKPKEKWPQEFEQAYKGIICYFKKSHRGKFIAKKMTKRTRQTHSLLFKQPPKREIDLSPFLVPFNV